MGEIDSSSNSTFFSNYIPEGIRDCEMMLNLREQEKVYTILRKPKTHLEN
jgi:hypothetical protein